MSELLASPLAGIQIIEDPRMTEDGEPYTVRRTWRERLLSLPWRPLRKTKTIVPRVPSKEFIRYGSKLIGHPETIKDLKIAIAKRGLSSG